MGVGSGVNVGVGAGVGVGVNVGIGVGVGVGKGVGTAVGIDAGLSIGIAFGIAVGTVARVSCNRASTVASMFGVGSVIFVGSGPATGDDPPEQASRKAENRQMERTKAADSRGTRNPLYFQYRNGTTATVTTPYAKEHTRGHEAPLPNMEASLT